MTIGLPNNCLIHKNIATATQKAESKAVKFPANSTGSDELFAMLER
jgi:hypothetical protein